MPLENIGRAARPLNLPGAVLGGIKSGVLKGFRVTHHAVAKVPAKLGGIGSTIASFFARKETAFKPASGGPAVKQTAPANAKPKTETAPKPLSEYSHPGDWFSSTKAYVEPSKEEQFASVYAGVRSLCDDLSDSKVNQFMRNSNSMSRVATNMGKPMAEHVRGIIVEQYGDTDALPLRDTSYEGQNGYPDLKKDGEDTETARNAAITADTLLRRIYGMGDHTSDDAAHKVPQNLCNALAIALRAVDDGDADEKQKEKARAKVKTDFVALRAINPALVTPQPGEELSPLAQRNIIELSKLSQNIANGVGTGASEKEKLHDEALRVFKVLGTVDTITAAFERFCQAVVDRADDDVVEAAVGRGEEMIEEFNNFQEMKSTEAIADANLNSGQV